MSPERRIKRGLLQLAQALGLFALARRSTARQLRILCYHGFDRLGDESHFRPPLFMPRETFARRLDHLQRMGHPVLSLDEALARLDEGSLPPGATVITLDDGFYSVLSEAAPELKRRRLPATLYVTTYHVQKQTPVFRLLVQYLLWRSPARELALPGLGRWPLDGAGQREAVAQLLWEHGEKEQDEQGRQALADRLARALAVDIAPIRASRAFGLMTEAELAGLGEFGIALALHSHRHRITTDDDRAERREIEDNRAVLEPIAGKRLQHFSYPSGIWAPRQGPWLHELGILSATTCLPGLNGPTTPRYALRRQLDAAHLGLLEFDAELSGFLPCLRRLLRRD